MSSLVGMLRDVAERLQEQNRRLAGMEMRGKIPPGGVDAATKKIRVVIGKDPDGADVLSPWVRVKQVAGALKLHSLPSEGQVMVIRSETGDIEQGVAEPYHWNDENPSPSDAADEHVLTFGDVKVTLRSDAIVIAIGGVTWTFDGQGWRQTSGTIKHDDIVIDRTHEHTGVTPGGGLTGPPKGG